MTNTDEVKGVYLKKTHQQPEHKQPEQNTVVEDATGVGNNTVGNVTEAVNNTLENVTEVVSNMIENATEVVNNIVENATEVVNNIVENALDMISDTENKGNEAIFPPDSEAISTEKETNEVADVIINLEKKDVKEDEEKAQIVTDLEGFDETNKAPVNEAPVNEAPIQDNIAQVENVKSLTNEAVTTHTATLWKYLPIPDNEPESAPEYIHREFQFPKSKVIASRVRGKKHKHDGTNCDDWYEVANYKDITIVAVSDGAGSKKFSRIGARESCKSSVGYLVKTFEEQFKNNPDLYNNLMLKLSEPKCMEACGLVAGIVQQSVIKAYEAVEATFYSRSVDLEYEKVLNRELQFKDFSGTLLIAVIIPVSKETKEHLVITCQIGDGMIALLNSEGEFENSSKLMGEADSGEFSGETDFLTSSKMKNIETLQSRTKISRCIVDIVLVMSDGVADDYFPNETEMRRLYFDLIVNGIIDSKKVVSEDCLSIEQMRLFKKIPDPLVYPWVNDQNVKIALQYTNRISEMTGLSLEDIWKDDTVLALARLELSEQNKIEDRSERLKVWLDNYVERGSFDDRTLVVVQM